MTHTITAPKTNTLAKTGTLAVTVFAVVSLAQAVTRSGFSLLRYPASALSTGDLGWIQIANFIISGILMLICADSLKHTLRGGRGRTWGHLLARIHGFGFIAAGIFTMDPPDTPAPTTISWHAGLHMLFGSAAFIAMIAACFVLASRLNREGQPHWATAGRICGTLFTIGLTWCNIGGTGGSLTLFLGAITAWTFIAATAQHLSNP